MVCVCVCGGWEREMRWWATRSLFLRSPASQKSEPVYRCRYQRSTCDRRRTGAEEQSGSA